MIRLIACAVSGLLGGLIIATLIRFDASNWILAAFVLYSFANTVIATGRLPFMGNSDPGVGSNQSSGMQL